MIKSDFSKIEINYNSNKFNFAVVNFGHLFQDLKNKSVPLSQRINKSTYKFRILAFEYPKIIFPLMDTITKLGNLHNNSFKDDHQRWLYQQSLSRIYSLMVKEVQKEGINNSLALILERGAILTGSFYNFPKNQIARIIAKRITLSNSQFGLGLANLKIPKNLKQFTKLHIQEDCIATGDSICGTILALKEKGISFKEIQIDTCAAAQVGINFIFKFMYNLKIKDVIIKTGALCFKLDEHFYLRRTKEEKYLNNEYYVGDMGEWSKILPKSFNKVAWWNRNRLDYK